MKVLWISWKDWNHPDAGGAEIVLKELVKRQITDGYKVDILTALYPNSKETEILDGANVKRLKGNRYLQPFVALPYFIKNMRNKHDVVIEVVNTAPYFSPFFRGKSKSILLYHQLARQVWFHEAPFPISWIGYYILEPVATFILGKAKVTTIAMSPSTKEDLVGFGFKETRVKVISEGIEIQPVKSLDVIKKYKEPTILNLGAMRTMKNTLDQVKAFEIAKDKMPSLKLIIAGSTNGKYAEGVLDYIDKSIYKKDIKVLGKVSSKKKIELMQKSHIVLQTSIKEGWGLTITEANSQGTPAIVYDSDGLRDSVKHDETGMVTKRGPSQLASAIVSLMSKKKKYNQLQKNAWQWSKEITFDQSYKDLKKVIGTKK